ncbi:MAG: hypothetical protein AAFV90_24275 [Cyanobacteria bacterium J06634_5]
MPPLMAQALSDGLLPDWQEICRQAIACRLPADKAKELNWPQQIRKEKD